MQLDSWQKEILEHNGDMVLCTGRQVGKTTIMAIKACKRMLENPGLRVIIISLTEDQAKLIISMMLGYLDKKFKKEIGKGKDKPTQNKITLKNGSSALARPVGTTGDAVRGFTGDILIIDEASRMPEKVFIAGEPTLLTTGGEIWICSTPMGKLGYFYKCFNNEDGNFKVFHISSEEVINNREITSEWTQERKEKALKRLEQQKKMMSRKEYGQEYLGLFQDDLCQLIPDELIEQVCILKRFDGIPDGKYYLGVDIARLGYDKGTLEVVKQGDVIRQVENIVTEKLLTTETERKIIEVAKLWNCRKIGIDAGAGTLGVSVLDHLLESEIKHKVEAVNNRAMSMSKDGKEKQKLMKVDLYNLMVSLMQQRRLELLEDMDIKLSLKSLQYEYVISPNKLSKLRIFGNDTHIAEGLIRAVYLASKDKSLNLWAY